MLRNTAGPGSRTSGTPSHGEPPTANWAIRKAMRGVNFGGWFSKVDAIQEKDPATFVDLRTHIETFLLPADFRRVKEWGFDHVRLPVDYFNVFEETSLRPTEPILDLLEVAIDGLTAAGLDIIFDLHKCPGHDFHAGARHAQEFFSNPVKREECKRVWRYIAERFGSRANVALELLNEPVAEQSADWDTVKDELSAHIRRYAPHSKLVVGSNRWNNPKEFDHLTPLRDDNVVYSFHFYSPLLFTHQLAPWLDGEVFQARRPYPGDYAIAPGTEHRLPLEDGRWDRARMEHELESVFRFRDKYQVPIACNEFGVFVGGANRVSQLKWMRDFVAILDEQGIGFSYWNYKNLDFGLVSRGESAFADYPQYQNTERVDHELAKLLLGT